MGPYCQYFKTQAKENRRPLESNQSIWRPWEGFASGSKLHCRFSDCIATFKRESELKRHELSIHDRNIEKCIECQQEFTRKDNLTRHMKLKHKHPEQKSPCGFCGKLLSRQDSATRHKTTCLKNPTNQSKRLSRKMKISNFNSTNSTSESESNKTDQEN